MAFKIVTPIFRASFPYLLEPKYNSESDSWLYTVTMIFEDDKETLQPMLQMLEQAKKELFPEGIPRNFASPFRRGEWATETNSRGFDLEKYPEYEGKIIATASTYTEKLSNGQFDLSKRPGIIGPNPAAIFDGERERLYSGMWGRAEISMYRPRNPKARHRISLGLENFQKCKDGDAIGFSRSRPETVFGAFETPDAVGENDDLLDV
jgi:hypothetical protein